MIERAIAARLSGATPAGNHVYPVILPQAFEPPALTYQVVAGDRIYALDQPSDLANPRIQIDCWAETYAGVIALRDAVMTALSGFKGDAGSPPVGIYGAFKVLELDGFEDPLLRAGKTLHRKTLHFEIWFRETT